MATVLVTSDRDHVPSAAEVSIKGADEAKNTFALKKTSRAARVLNPQSIWDETALLEALRADGIKDLHAWTIWKHLIRASDPATVNFEDIADVPKRVPEVLRGKFVALTSRLVKAGTSKDGQTTKLLIELQDGHLVEAVIIRHHKEDSDKEDRVTLCVSSQVGCQMGCTFCATGTMGLKGNLRSSEIIEQLVYANMQDKVRNVVFMGMGEPLNNYDEVLKAVRCMTDASRFNLAPGRVTVSTVGIVPRMLQMTREAPNIQLALSLHAPTQEMRQRIVPAGRAFKLDKVMGALDDYLEKTGKRALIEYTMLAGVNDSAETAHALGQLLQHKNVLLNLIPYNPTDVDMSFRCPDLADVQRFLLIVKQEYGIFTTVRHTMGQDIAGACGQLSLKWQHEHQQNKPANGGAADSKGACCNDQSCDCKHAESVADSSSSAPDGVANTGSADTTLDEIDEDEMNVIAVNEARYLDPACMAGGGTAADTMNGKASSAKRPTGDIEDLFATPSANGAGVTPAGVRQRKTAADQGASSSPRTNAKGPRAPRNGSVGAAAVVDSDFISASAESRALDDRPVDATAMATKDSASATFSLQRLLVLVTVLSLIITATAALLWYGPMHQRWTWS